MTIHSKGSAVYRTNMQLEELLHLDFAFYNSTYICGLTAMMTVVLSRTKMIWTSPNYFNQLTVRIIRFIMKTLKNKKNMQTYES